MRELALVTFGWLLGMLAPAVVSKIEKYSRKKEYKICIASEVEELRYKVASLAFQLAWAYGSVDLALIKWLQAIEKEYHGEEKESHIEQFLRMTEGKKDDEIRAIFAATKKDGQGKSLKKYSLPLLSGNPSILFLFTPSYQRAAFQIIAKLSEMNEEIDIAMFSWKQGFDSSITPGNSAIIQGNLISSYNYSGSMAKVLAEKCSKILEIKG